MQPHESRAHDNEDDIERAIEDKREDVLAADATGMVGSLPAPRVVDSEPAS